MNYKITDNFLSENCFEKIYSEITQKYFPWYLQDKINDNEKESNLNFYFSHTFFNKKINSDFFPIWEELITKINCKTLIRIKANLYPKTDAIIEHAKHIDITDIENTTTALYYVNTNNGFTNLNDEIKINSVKNRFVEFDNNVLHNSSTCSDEKFRLTVVVNYIK